MPKPPANTANLTAVADLPPELKRLHEMANVYATANRDLTLEHARLENEYHALVQRRAPLMVELSGVMDRTLKGLEEHVRQHPELLGEKRSIKTPFGTIKLVATSELVAANPEAVINKLYTRAARVGDFDALDYLRVKTTLDLEALEKLEDRILNQLGIVRSEGDSFSFKLTVVNIKEALAASAVVPEQMAA